MSTEKSEKSSDRIIKIIIKNEKITTEEIAFILGISRRAVEKQIAKLKEEGLLKRIGGRKEGYWKITSKYSNKGTFD